MNNLKKKTMAIWRSNLGRRRYDISGYFNDTIGIMEGNGQLSSTVLIFLR